MKAVILAGGVGIRLRPFTFSIPKPLLPIGEKPILEIIIRRLKKFGFKEFILAVGYRSKMIEAYFGNGSELGIRISYLREKGSSGTAGPLVQLRNKFRLKKNEFFLLINGDIMTKLNFLKMIAFHKEGNFDLSIGIKSIKEKTSYGFVNLNGAVVQNIVEKPKRDRIINTGIYVINSSVIDEIPRNRFFTMPDLVNKLILKNRPVGAYTIKEYWLGLEELQNFEEIYNNKHLYKALSVD